MGTTQLRSEVESFIKKADSRFLKMVHAMAVAYSQKEIVAYTTDGIPLTKEAYVKEMEESEKDVKSGKVMTTKELKKRISTWKKS